jgi:hypothetical protein
MPQYVMLLHENPAVFENYGPAEMQAVIEKYKAWSQKTGASGHLRGGQKLRDGEGRVLRTGANGLAVIDGPYSEAKEVIGGFFLLEAANYEEAVRVSRDCPHVEYGVVELREVEPT